MVTHSLTYFLIIYFGAYAEGGYEVFVPKTVFEEWLKEEYRDVFE